MLLILYGQADVHDIENGQTSNMLDQKEKGVEDERSLLFKVNLRPSLEHNGVSM